MSTEAPLGGAQAVSLRQAIYGKGEATRTDLVGLMALGAELGDAPEFLALVADVAVDALIKAAELKGCLSDGDADWFCAHLGDGRGLANRAEYEALKTVLARAVSVPPALVAFAVREVERAILTGRRSVLGGADWTPGLVTAQDVEALREVLAGREGKPGRIDAASAEALFDIAHATATARNDATFPDFFARAVGSYLAGAAFAAAPSRAEALAAEAERERPVSVADFLRGLPAASRDGLPSVDHLGEDPYAEENAATQARLEAAARIDAGGARWVLAHLTRGGELCEAERRLIAFLRDAASHPAREAAGLLGQAA